MEGLIFGILRYVSCSFPYKDVMRNKFSQGCIIMCSMEIKLKGAQCNLSLQNLGCPAHDLYGKAKNFWLPESRSRAPGATGLY